MDDRVERLWDKAEKSIDINNTDQAEAYRQLAGHVAWHRRKLCTLEQHEAEDPGARYDGYWYWCERGEPHPTEKGADDCADRHSRNKAIN